MANASIDWAALYQKHRDAMFRVAKNVLRSSGRIDLADDAVQEAMVSLMKSPPSEPPRSWEALLVATAKRRALDMVGSAAMVNRAMLEEERASSVSEADMEDLLERLERMALVRAAIAKAKLDARAHYVLAQYMVLERPRAEVAAELGVTPARVSQIATKVLTDINTAVTEGG
ncbi:MULTISPECIES: sigma-70 family RNA polymerase sigma factor [unclassified Microbacterium]|uniref:sigma-70 family RNA polymerase sigma factor n=1 Tax=unclassified Microbacterium TaxID=2609290 RepID=UPI0036523792